MSTSFDAPTRSLGRGRSGKVRVVINTAAVALVLVALPAIVGPAFMAAQTGSQFGTGELGTQDLMTALAGFVLGSGLGVLLLRVGERIGRRGR